MRGRWFFDAAKIEERKKKSYHEIASEASRPMRFQTPVVGRICRLVTALVWQKLFMGFLEEDE